MPALIALSAIMAIARWNGSADPPPEHIRGTYVQQAIEIAAVGDRLVRLTRMTRFVRCRTRRPLAQEINGHVVEVLGVEVSGVGFVAAIVNATEGCEPDDGPTREARRE